MESFPKKQKEKLTRLSKASVSSIFPTTWNNLQDFRKREDTPSTKYGPNSIKHIFQYFPFKTPFKYVL